MILQHHTNLPKNCPERLPQSGHELPSVSFVPASVRSSLSKSPKPNLDLLARKCSRESAKIFSSLVKPTSRTSSTPESALTLPKEKR